MQVNERIMHEVNIQITPSNTIRASTSVGVKLCIYTQVLQ